ncbi:cell division protein FtsQ/DivIB [Aliikangiella sp. IMCC44632]
MARAKMAVRKKRSEKKSLSFDFSGRVKQIGRVLVRYSLLALIVGGVYSGQRIWQQVWPVENLVLQGDVQNLNEAKLVELVADLEVKGMLAIDLESLRNQLEELAWVQHVEVKKVWPNSIVVAVREHQPVAIFNNAILTASHTQIEVSEAQAKLFNLPRIEVKKQKTIDTETLVKIWTEFKQIKTSLELISLELVSVEIDLVNNWHLHFSRDLVMNLGRKDREARIARLVEVYRAIENKDAISSIDLRYHNGIAVQWAENNNSLQG